MTGRAKTIILIVLAVLLAPVLVLFLLALSAAGQLLCGRIYRGGHEGIHDFCGIASTFIIFPLLLYGAVAGVVVPLHRLLRLKHGLGVRKSDPSR